jgi:hypothetical protein
MSFPSPFDDDERTLLEKVEKLQAGFIGCATQDGGDIDAAAYERLRMELIGDATTRGRLPEFVRKCRDQRQFWQFIKNKFPSYRERRDYIWAEFRPVIDYLELQERTPGVEPITLTLEAFDPEHVHAAWQKALDRRAADPDGAITAARTLLETVCKHVLDKAGKTYADDAELPQLWKQCAELLKLAPDQHQEQIFKSMLGSCQNIVASLGAVRNKIGDAHGARPRAVKPKPRHAELAVNLAGTMASFLVATWREQQGKPS